MESPIDKWLWDWLEVDLPLWVRPAYSWVPLLPPPTGWEETTTLVAGLAAENDDLLVPALLQVNPVLAGRCLTEGQAEVDREVREDVTAALLRTIARGEVALRVRVAAGQVLGYLGYPRLGGDGGGPMEIPRISAGLPHLRCWILRF